MFIQGIQKLENVFRDLSSHAVEVIARQLVITWEILQLHVILVVVLVVLVKEVLWSSTQAVIYVFLAISVSEEEVNRLSQFINIFIINYTVVAKRKSQCNSNIYAITIHLKVAIMLKEVLHKSLYFILSKCRLFFWS